MPKARAKKKRSGYRVSAQPETANWEARIEEAIARQTSTPPGRGGETPIGELAIALSQLPLDSSAAQRVNLAIIGLIGRHTNSSSSFWQGLCLLIRSADFQKDRIREALVTLLNRGQPSQEEARARVLLATADIGRRFTPAELLRERGIRADFPLLWIEAAATSGQYDMAAEEIESCLKDRRCNVRDIRARLPNWYQKLGNETVRYARRWLSALHDDDERRSLIQWFEIRHIVFENPTKEAGTADIQRPMDRSTMHSWAHFISDAYGRTAARLNGAADPNLDEVQ